MNVVAERCTLVAEVRGLVYAVDDLGEDGLGALLLEAANLPDCDCDVDVDVQRTFSGYHLSPGSTAVQVAAAALAACGHEPSMLASGGGSDANALIASGFQCVNLANGTERNHEPGERVAEAALQEMFDVALSLLESAADLAPAAAV